MNIKEEISKLIPSAIYLKRIYKKNMGRSLNLKNPQTYNEKIQWLKLHDHNPRYIKLVDKYESKKEVAKLIGEEYIIPTLGVWNSFDEIDFESLPDQFVLKTTHDSGSVVVCKNKQDLDMSQARTILESSLKRNYYYPGREWPYKKIKHRIIAESYIDDKGKSPEDYKILCFHGKPDNVMVCMERETGITKYYFFDMNWELMRCNGWGKKAPADFTLSKPENFEKMIKIACVLSKDIPLARIDLYNIKGKIYFGEVTLYPDSGFDRNYLPETDRNFGEKIKINRV